MSEEKVPAIPAGILSADQIEAVSGGACTPQQWIEIASQLKGGYESLVDFTSYVIERVVAK